METREKSRVGQFNNDAPAKSHLSKLTSAGALLSGPAVEEDKAKSGCVFCDGSHRFDSCKIVASVNQGLDILRRHRKCFKCLETALLMMWWEPSRGFLLVSGNTNAGS